MPMYKYSVFGIFFGLLMSMASALAFDGSASNSDENNPVDAFKAGAKAYYAGDKKEAFNRLRYAAEKGHAIAQWKLGRMYAQGDGVDVDEKKAFEYFSRVANDHADDNPNTPQATFVASSFVALGNYFHKGIENTVSPNLRRARDMYTYAASYFGDADAQFALGRMYLTGEGGRRDTRQAARWLKLAARKAHVPAAAIFGEVVFTGGEKLPPRPIFGLAWLSVARYFANPHDRSWVSEKQEHYFGLANIEEREQALRIAKIIIEQINSP